MSELSEKQLADLAKERARIFTRGWFADLLVGRLGFGDTFWLGLFATAFGVVPVVVLLAGLLHAMAPAAMLPFLRVFSGLYGLWAVAILRALLRVGGRGILPMVGLGTAAVLAVLALGTAATL